jgi:hypothetical protein
VRSSAPLRREKSGKYLCPPATPEPGSELARNEELGEQLEGEGGGGQCEQGVSVEGLLRGIGRG